MATPMNPLDVFATYTYHFELHAAKDWDTLKGVANVDVNATTTRTESNGTLLINTRKDAHQAIDDVRFTYKCSDQNQYGQFTPAGKLTMTIFEPAGAFFIEKIYKKMTDEDVTSLQNLIFGLKIFFVGRLPNNTIVTIPMPNIIPMTFNEMTSKFSYSGGEYNCEFFLTGGAAEGVFQPQLGIGYFNKNISIKAKTVKEALRELEKNLNSSYNNDYEKVFDNPNGCRLIKYFINVDPVLDGKLTVNGSDSWAPDDFSKLTFNSSETVLTWINTIVRSSKEINEIVGASYDNLTREDQPGVKLVSILPRYYPKKDSIEIHYDVSYYEGGGDDLYTFDFLFSEPGANVDVLDFEMQLARVNAWLAGNSGYGVDQNRSASATMSQDDPKKMTEDIIHPDQSKDSLYCKPEKFEIPGKSGDIAFLNSMPRSERTGFVNQKHEGVAAARLAFSTITAANGATTPQVAFTIRGHLNLLERGIIFPDESMISGAPPIGTKKLTQIKVNIKSPDSDHLPFYYTGKYGVTAIDSVFSGGKFTQILHVWMQTEEEQRT